MKTLVLDLDETLIHSSNMQMMRPDIHFKMDKDGQEMEIFVKQRPFVKEFLSIVSKYYEVVVFTAGMPNVSNFSPKV